MQVEASTFTILFKQPAVSSVAKIKGYTFSNECAITLSSFDELLASRKKDASHIPYLIAKVKDVRGGIHVFDGAILTTPLKRSFTNPSSNEPIKNIKFYQLLGKNGIGYDVVKVDTWTAQSFAESQGKSAVPCFDPTLTGYRVLYAIDCLNANKVEEAVRWAKVCVHDVAYDNNMAATILTVLGKDLISKTNDRETAIKDT